MDPFQNLSESHGNSSGIGEVYIPENMDFDSLEPQRRFIETLRRRYRFIKKELHPINKIVDALYSHSRKFISRACMEQVLALTRSDKTRANDVFIKDIVRNLSKLDDSRYELIEAELYSTFKECDCMFLLEGNSYNSSDNEDERVNSFPTLTMKELEQVLQMRTNKELLKDELEPLRIIDKLLEDGQLTFDDHEDIRITCSRLERVSCLLGYIERDILNKTRAFLQAVHLCNPGLVKKMLMNLKTVDSSKEHSGLRITVQQQGRRQISIEAPIGGNFDFTVRLRFNGEHGEITAVEREVVDVEHPSLDSEAMECDTGVLGLSFSSVVILLRVYSPEAAKMLTDKLINCPEGLQQWLNKLLTEEQKLKLKDASFNSIQIEIGTVPCEMISVKDCQCLLSTTNLQGESMLASFREFSIDLGAILKQLYNMSEVTYDQRKVIKRLVDMQDYDSKIREFQKFLYSFDCKDFCMLEIAFRRTGQTRLLEQLTSAAAGDVVRSNTKQTRTRHTEIKRCTSMSSNYTIEMAFQSQNTPLITHIDTFLQEIREVDTLNNEQRGVIDTIKPMVNEEYKTRELLRLLVELPQPFICRFEAFLKRTGQQLALRNLEKQNELRTLDELTKEEIVENLSFLCDEIEPRIFRHVLSEDQQTDLQTHVRRRKRCRVFFKHILESHKSEDYIRQFETELKRLKLFDILNILKSSKRSKNLERARIDGDILKHKILQNKQLLADEIDIQMMKSTFIDRNILTEERFDTISNRGTRREGVIALLKAVLEEGYPAMICLVSALKIAGYSFIAGSIENAAEPCLPCPCNLPPSESTMLVDTSFSVQVSMANGEECSPRLGSISNTTNDSPEVEQNKDPGQQVDKRDFIENWLKDCPGEISDTPIDPQIVRDSKRKVKRSTGIRQNYIKRSPGKMNVIKNNNKSKQTVVLRSDLCQLSRPVFT